MKRDLFFAAMMLREGLVDGSVAGSFASTADVMKAGIQIVGMPQGISIVSSFFLMLFKDKALQLCRLCCCSKSRCRTTCRYCNFNSR